MEERPVEDLKAGSELKTSDGGGDLFLSRRPPPLLSPSSPSSERETVEVEEQGRAADLDGGRRAGRTSPFSSCPPASPAPTSSSSGAVALPASLSHSSSWWQPREGRGPAPRRR
ncbi:unnamed protein product [Urochloa humidicola]